MRCIVHKIYCHFILSRQFHEVCVQNGFISQYFHNTQLCQALIVELLPKSQHFSSENGMFYIYSSYINMNFALTQSL